MMFASSNDLTPDTFLSRAYLNPEAFPSIAFTRQKRAVDCQGPDPRQLPREIIDIHGRHGRMVPAIEDLVYFESRKDMDFLLLHFPNFANVF